MSKKIFLISGPTASGKTSLSINTALYLREHGIDSEIVNFDSLLFYQGMNIGTAKPTAEEQKGIPHHLIDIVPPDQPLNASDYCKKAIPIIQSLHQKNKVPILVGGSGFYVRALIKGMYESPTTPESVAKKVDTIFQKDGIDGIIEELRNHDQDSYQTLHRNDHYRLIRALEHFYTTGVPLSSEKKRLNELRPYDFTQSILHDWDITHLYLNPSKDEHLQIMATRIDQMLDNGLIDEVKSLLEKYSPNNKPLQSIGYKESIQFLNGELETVQDLKEAIHISTRQLAKAQRTFFKKIVGRIELNPLDKIDLSRYITTK